jgi:hypothetical protein
MMANEVYANGMEVACKAGAGKTICAMPDVCFTPPENPATPPGVPVPYPNTGLASDTTDGSKSVMISGKEVMLKNKSYFKKSTGDEAGAAAKKGLISSTNTGKVYFIKWSIDVKFEGENADRHLDMTTDNHASPGANDAVPWLFTDSQVPPSSIDPCEAAANNADKADDFGPKKATRTDEGGNKITYDTVPAGGVFVPDGGIPALPGVLQSGVNLMSHSSVSARDIRPNTARAGMSGGQGGGVACPGKTFPVRKAGHAEVKMIEDILVGRYPGSLTRGAYKPKGTLHLTVKRKEICCSCQQAIKCAEAQGIKFKFCNDNEGNETKSESCS